MKTKSDTSRTTISLSQSIHKRLEMYLADLVGKSHDPNLTYNDAIDNLMGLAEGFKGKRGKKKGSDSE